jgi:ethanolamine ammonia-lyase small subunit
VIVSASASRSVIRASWARLRGHTPARIAIGRAGSGLPTAAHLEFQAAHARARDAVHARLDADAMLEKLIARGFAALHVRSAAGSREEFLRRPDLGRALSAQGKARVSEPMLAPDVVIVIGDGLSSVAVERNAMAVLDHLWPQLRASALALAPIIVAEQARVALADEIGELLQAKVSVIMIGERPGLSAADSLGMYLTYAPRVGRVDSERNCISNIRDGGMGAQQAAVQAADLIRSMLAHGASGILLASRADRLAGQAANLITGVLGAALIALALVRPVNAADAPSGAASCSGCHPAKAFVDTAVPRLAGRTPAEIVAAMQGFKSGKLPSTVMGGIAKGFSDSEIEAIAAWYGAQRQ